jgi:serine/threonine-protein kinase
VFAGRYRMITRINRGGRRDVWQADDLLLNTPVALKLIRSASAATRARVNQEVRLSRQITHHAVCRVFDIGEEGDTMFFSMELVQGGNLAALLKRTGRLAPERVLHIAHQLCSALTAVHRRGVLHGDLTPSNVLIDQAGQLRIIGFGKSVPVNDRGQRTIVGTRGYLAPEQLASGAPLSECTDVYAVGAILYELVTGRRPDSSTESHGRAVPPSRLVPGMSLRLERAILKALSLTQTDRPPTALALAAELPPLDDARGSAPVRRSSPLARWDVWRRQAAAVSASLVW